MLVMRSSLSLHHRFSTIWTLTVDAVEVELTEVTDVGLCYTMIVEDDVTAVSSAAIKRIYSQY